MLNPEKPLVTHAHAGCNSKCVSGLSGVKILYSLLPSLHYFTCAVVIFLHIWLLSSAIFRCSPTVDEVAHLPAGLSHWRFRQFDLYRVNPPLSQTIASIPLLFNRNLKEEWQSYSSVKTFRAEFAVGRDFIDANASGSLSLYRLCRFMGIFFSLIGAISIYVLACDFYGKSAGAIALSLWCFSPAIIGNAAIITPDVPAAAMIALATMAFFRWLTRRTFLAWLFSGFFLGVALLTKFTCLVLLGCWPAVWLITVLFGRNWKTSSFFRDLLSLAGIFLVSLYVVNVGYLFDETFIRLGDYKFASQAFSGRYGTPGNLGNRFADGIFSNLPVPLPADFVHGIDLQKLDFESPRYSYACGTQKLGGWWWWYAYGLLVKTPDGTLVLLLLRVFLIPAQARSKSRKPLTADLVLLIAATIFLLVSSQTAFSRYMRYLLPAAPFAFVWISGVSSQVLPLSIGWRILIMLCCTSNLVSCELVKPHFLAYFNELSGGARNGHWHLVDANIDWGQATLELKRWVDENDAGVLYASLFADDFCMHPSQLNLEVKPLQLDKSEEDGVYRPHPISELPKGLYAISVNHLHGYRHHGKDIDCSIFLGLKPIARVGYAIYVYRL